MYEELVKALRWCADESICCDDFSGEKCPHYSVRGDDCNMDVVLHDASAAIEALQAEQNKTVTQIFGEEKAAWEGRCKDLMYIIADLQAKVPHWVSVRQPPKERDFYFAFTADGEAKVCDYIPSVDQWWDGDYMILSVTHWMPIEPPMEVQE